MQDAILSLENLMKLTLSERLLEVESYLCGTDCQQIDNCNYTNEIIRTKNDLYELIYS